MESFLPSEIARLVLGYLEDQKCEDAYDAFLRTSLHLEECLKMKEDGRKFRTQVMGLNLIDILYEYSAIYSLIEERLKKVDPETANSLKYSGSLMDKLTFLLNATGSGQTMLFSITLPPGKSPSTVAHVRKRLRTTSDCDKKKHGHQQNKLIDEQCENANKKLETTSLSSLPGNSKQNICLGQFDHLGDEIVRTPKRKSFPLNSSRRSRSSSVIREESEENLDVTVLTKLLDNHELHEKIAENINKIIRTPDLVSKTPDLLCSAQNPIFSDSNMSVSNFTFELDNAIKMIVKQTESDPVFENILQEVIGPVEEISDGEDRGITDTSTPSQSTPETIKKHSLRHRLRSSKKRAESPVSSSSDLNSPSKIDHQNAAAIESIISIQSNQDVGESVIKENKLEKDVDLSQREIVMQHAEPISILNAQPVTVQEGTVENIILNKNKNVTIMPQSAAPPANYQSTSIPDNSVVIVSSKMTSSGSQIVTVQPAQFQIKPQTATFISESDILTMPTVIINDENNPSNSYIVPQKVFPTVASTTAVPEGELNNAAIFKQTVGSRNRLIAPKETFTYTINVQNSDSKPSTSKQEDKNIVKSLPLISLNSENKEENAEEKSVTPEKSNKKTPKSLSSPRSCRSHIRALDFSTPPKESFLRKSSTSPKAIKSGKVTKSLRQNRSSLFTSPLNLPIATRSPRMKLQGEWDESELIFAPSKTIRKSNEVQTESKSGKNQESDKLLVIDESKTKIEVAVPKKSKPKKKGSSWDQDLRTHIEPEADIPKKKKTTKKNKRIKVSEQNTDSNEATSKVEEEKTTNETETEKNLNSSKENIQIQNESEKIENCKPENNFINVTKRRRITKTKSISKEETEIKEENVVKEENAENLEQNTELKERLRNMKPRVNKKCNMGNVCKSTSNQEDKQKTMNETNTGVVVLSPSKMNANKRIFVEQEKPEINVLQATSRTATETSNKSEANIITPDMIKPSCSNIVTVKRNLTPILETPLKCDSSLLPITPRFLTPFGTDASITKLLQQNCSSVDFTSIMTPSFPLTPSFALTPNLLAADTQSSYVSRPTDYSNSSSYYQPSDSEQNQKLEQIFIEEAMKTDTTLEKQISTPDKLFENKQLSSDNSNPNILNENNFNDSATNTFKIENLKVVNKTGDCSQNDKDIDMLSTSDCNESSEDLYNESETNTTVINITPSNLRRGGKHMATLKKLLEPSNESSNSEKSDLPENSEKSLIPKKKIVKELTKKQADSTKSNANKSKKSSTIQPRKVNSNVTNAHHSLLEELEIKRKRTISELKNEEVKPKVTRKPRTKRKFGTSTRITRSKSISRINYNEIKQETEQTQTIKRRTRILKKNASIEDVAARLKKDKNVTQEKEKTNMLQQNEIINVEMDSTLLSLNSSNDSFKVENNLTLLSTDDEEIQELHLSSDGEDNSINIIINNNEDPDNLVKGLKERGIHLIPKKSSDKISETSLKDEDNPNIINSQPLNFSVQPFETNSDLELNIPQNIINKKIKIKSDVYLGNSEKYDVLKILSQDNVISNDSIGKKVAKENKNESEKEEAAKLTKIHEAKNLITDKSNKISEKPLVETKSGMSNTNVVKVLNVTEFDEELFHVKILTEDSPEFIKMKHNENEKITKTLSDYNFAVLEKQISAKVFLEELNVEQDRVLSVTPFLELLSLPIKVPTVVLKPLEVLYNEIVDESSVDTLFGEDQSKLKTDKLIKMRNTDKKSKTDYEKQKIKTASQKPDSKSIVKKAISLEQYKTKRKTKENLEEEKQLHKIGDDTDKISESYFEEDSLMIFALTGKDKTLKKETSAQDSNSKKRKAEADVSKQTIEKKIKPSVKHALLKTLDVDKFLSKLHGPSKETT